MDRFYRDQIVKIRRGNTDVYAIIISKADFTRAAWWVQYDDMNGTDVNLFFEDDLIEWNSDPNHEPCTCGSATVGSSKHSSWCDSLSIF